MTCNKLPSFDRNLGEFNMYNSYKFNMYKFFLIFHVNRFLVVAVSAASFLHMLTPAALNHHSVSLFFVWIGQIIISAPIGIACFTIWKDWAPPAERTKLLTFSLYGIFVGSATLVFFPFLYDYKMHGASFYLSGIAGFIWVLFWFNITSDTPENDPLISEEEIIYLENNIPSDHLHKMKTNDIPWKSILFSRPVLVLCMLFFKMGASTIIIRDSGQIIFFYLIRTYGVLNPLDLSIPFVSTFAIFVPLNAILADFLIKKFSGKTLLIRKIFLCAGTFLQCVFMLGTLADSEFIEIIFFMISYSFFAVSIPGFITIALDLSPRYVSVIAGIAFIFYRLGEICTRYFLIATYDFKHLSILSWIFLFDGVVSVLSVIFFLMWGEAEEQLWSLTFPTNRKGNDFRSYPKPEDEDDLNLVP